MKNSVLPIFHYAQLRGFLLAHAAHAEIFDSLEALHGAAISGDAIRRLHEEKDDAAGTCKESLHVEPAVKEMAPSSMEGKINIADALKDLHLRPSPPFLPEESKYKLGDNARLLMETDEFKDIAEGQARVSQVCLEDGKLTAIIEPVTAAPDPTPAVNQELTMEEASRRFPHFASAIEAGKDRIVTEREDEEENSQESAIGHEDVPERDDSDEKPLQSLKSDDLPEGIIVSSSWPKESIIVLLTLREPQHDGKPLGYERIAAKLGKQPGTCIVKYKQIKDSGALDAWRRMRGNTPVPAIPQEEYAGERQKGQALQDSDWPDIEHMMNKKRMAITDISAKYKVDFWEMREFINMHQKEAAHA